MRRGSVPGGGDAMAGGLLKLGTGRIATSSIARAGIASGAEFVSWRSAVQCATQAAVTTSCGPGTAQSPHGSPPAMLIACAISPRSIQHPAIAMLACPNA